MVLNDINGSSCKLYSLTWSEFGTSLASAVRNLRNLEDLTDVTVSAGGKIFPAHKLILSAASPLLMELLKNAKCQHPILMLAGISSSDFETILDFVYQGEVNIDSEKLPSLLQAAQLLDIQALSPTALVMNPPASTCNNEDTSLAYSNATPNNSSIMSSKISSKQTESPDILLKRKRTSRSVETSKISSVDSCKKACPTGDADNRLAIQPPPILPVKVDEVNSQEEDCSIVDEKKIISDLPVNCKLCGVTIRQSRNLRRHIDHMHLKQKLRSKSKDTKDKESESESVLNTFKAAFTKKIDDFNNNPGTSAVLNFSEDSFTQLTEEIFNCTAVSTLSSGESSLSSSNIQMTSSTCTYAAEPLPRPPNGDSCAPASTACSGNDGQTKSSAAKTYECNSLEDSCNMNDITLKELETQLFSVCFCSAEGEDGQQ
ncbi:hypothetical protein V9T40_001689 [Parthenolecanium corni]|uniref:BTB domain-containing protein n=1 Tax=Parthenolecanium corni TaxID=536013 RepID=A0AAN9TW21_9HEMI